MHNRSRSPSERQPATTTTADNAATQQDQQPAQDKISAYYSLVFPHFTFYIQTLSITIGRRCTPNANAASSSSSEASTVDVDLGALKSVSRLHAKIEYDQDEDRFVLAVIGRNGAWVDGVWAASGTRAPLAERSQVQIASRTFHFVLPPPPPPEDSPSPSSQSSANNRARSPSVDVDVDITSISPPSSQPSHSPIRDLKPLPPSPLPLPKSLSKPDPPPPQLPNSNNIGKSAKSSSKKRKKGESDPAPVIQRPKPEDIPPKPPFTYAQLIYRAIKDIGGKATLQEICNWIVTKHEYYRWADGAWMSSVRHNLSSGRAFLKMERCGGDRGKGFFWSVDEKYSQQLEEQEIKLAQQAAQAASVAKEPKQSKKKDKQIVLEPPLKRSIKGDLKGTPLPPPLTSTPLAFKTITASVSQPGPVATTTPSTAPVSVATTGVFAYPTHSQHSVPVTVSSQPTASTSSVATTAQNPYASLTQWHAHPSSSTAPTTVTSAPKTSTAPPASATTTLPKPTYTSHTPAPPSNLAPTPTPVAPTIKSPPPASTPTTAPIQTLSPGVARPAPAPGQPSMVPDVHIPIILGPIPPTHPDYAPAHPNNSKKEGYMVLHERKLILDPDVFSGLSAQDLKALEGMGARGALVVLTGHMVKALKERRRQKGIKSGKREREKGEGKRKKVKVPMTAPFTNAPLERRGVPVGGAAVPAAGMPTQSAGAGPSTLAQPIMNSLQPTPAPHYSAAAGVPASTTAAPPTSAAPTATAPPPPPPPPADPGSPIINIEDSDDEAPANKRRKLDDGSVASTSLTPVPAALQSSAVQAVPPPPVYAGVSVG